MTAHAPTPAPPPVPTPVSPHAADRRRLVRGALALGLTAATGASLVSCGVEDPTPSGAAGPRPTPAPGTPLGTTTDVPVGGGRIFGGSANVVVTQPREGVFAAFSSVCTHSGCLVTKVDRGLIECRCHGSRFSIEDGAVERGPALTPLPPVPIRTVGETITVA